MNDPRVLSRRAVHDGRIVKLSVDRVLLPNGAECEMEMIRHPGAAAVVPIDAEGRALLVRQYRYATGGWIVEVPAGKLDGGEPPERCARREVEEETGFRAGRLLELGWIWTTPGFTDERIWLYAALDLVATRQRLQQDEVLEIEPVPLRRAVEMARGGELQDAKSVCALLRVPPELIEAVGGE
jgi:ADP-ribose pyrophosphatase